MANKEGNSPWESKDNKVFRPKIRIYLPVIIGDIAIVKSLPKKLASKIEAYIVSRTGKSLEGTISVSFRYACSEESFITKCARGLP